MALSLCLHYNVDNLNEYFIRNDGPTQHTQPELASNYLDAGAGSERPRGSGLASSAVDGGLGAVGNLLEHGLHDFLLTEQVKIAVEAESRHDLEGQRELGPSAS